MLDERELVTAPKMSMMYRQASNRAGWSYCVGREYGRRVTFIELLNEHIHGRLWRPGAGADIQGGEAECHAPIGIGRLQGNAVAETTCESS